MCSTSGGCPSGPGPGKNGFDLSNSLIPVDEILSDGPLRDGIPSINDPKFESAANYFPLQELSGLPGILSIRKKIFEAD